MTRVHRSLFAGQWYPADRSALCELLQGVFRKSEQRTGLAEPHGEAAFVVPHAAPQYSGTVAAAAYRRMAALRPDRIVILGFAHEAPGAGILIPAIDAYRTPLGDVAIDGEDREALLRDQPFAIGNPADHSVEIQLPFLQFTLADTLILPLYVGCLSRDEMAAAVHALERMMRPGTVLLASSDLTHYGRGFGYLPFAVDTNTPERLRTLDQQIVDSMGTLDPDTFYAVLRHTGATMCGYLPVHLLMELMRTNARNVRQKLLDYQTSGEITSDYGHSVSYAALAYA